MFQLDLGSRVIATFLRVIVREVGLETVGGWVDSAKKDYNPIESICSRSEYIIGRIFEDYADYFEKARAGKYPERVGALESQGGLEEMVTST